MIEIAWFPNPMLLIVLVLVSLVPVGVLLAMRRKLSRLFSRDNVPPPPTMTYEGFQGAWAPPLARIASPQSPVAVPWTVQLPLGPYTSGPVRVQGVPSGAIAGLPSTGPPPIHVTSSDRMTVEEELTENLGFRRDGNTFTGRISLGGHRTECRIVRRAGGSEWELLIRPTKHVRESLVSDPKHGTCFFPREEWLFCHFNKRNDPIAQLHELEQFSRRCVDT